MEWGTFSAKSAIQTLLRFNVMAPTGSTVKSRAKRTLYDSFQYLKPNNPYFITGHRRSKSTY